MTTFEINIFNIVDGLINGGGNETGIGPCTDKDISMTAATECFRGTSGRGNSRAKSMIRGAGHLGLVRVVKRGRNERVFLTDKGINFHSLYKDEYNNG